MQPRVALINMPVSDVQTPSMGLSTLKGALNKHGIASRLHYLNIWFCELVGVPMQARLQKGAPHPHAMLNEFLFRTGDEPDDEARDRDYVETILRPEIIARFTRQRMPLDDSLIDGHVRSYLELRKHVRPFLDRCVREIPWTEYRVAAFTSVFQQRMAVLALARRLKAAHPHLTIVVGGSNCEGSVGAATFRLFPEFDAVFSGEADATFPLFVERVLADEPIGEIPGVMHRQTARRSLAMAGDACGTKTPVSMIEDMDSLAFPDFDDYFAQHTAARLPRDGQVLEQFLHFESSRGCWYGAKVHCTFCGLNPETMRFRHKSGERAYQELKWMLERYGEHTRSVVAVDNIIPYDYFKTFLPRLKELDANFTIFYETKANLRKEQVELYKAAGLDMVQPGIESLSSPILRLMRKGVTALQNLQLLKWCQQYGVMPGWIYLYGFPGEKADYYANQPALFRAVVHLPPPTGMHELRFHRFSPYLNEPESFGVRNLRPLPSYRFIFPDLDDRARAEIAYFFDGEFDGMEQVLDYTAAARAGVREWRDHHPGAGLFSDEVDGVRLIVDRRPATFGQHVVAAGLARAVLDACDAVASRSALGARLAAAGFGHVAPAEVDATVEALMARGLVVHDEGAYLALVVPLGSHYRPSQEALDELAALRARVHELPVIAPGSRAAGAAA